MHGRRFSLTLLATATLILGLVMALPLVQPPLLRLSSQPETAVPLATTGLAIAVAVLSALAMTAMLPRR